MPGWIARTLRERYIDIAGGSGYSFEAVVRQHLSHLLHHRGQQTVYLRLRDVPLPQIYGPTADERW